jgi:GntR family transcriptional regulator
LPTRSSDKKPPRSKSAFKEKSSESRSRYVQVAHELIDKISSGHFPVGSKVPTEAELCEQYSISRFTARQALRNLTDAGLVVRRPRAGTVVVALPDEDHYTHSVVSLRSLLQYAQTTTLHFAFIGKVPLDRELASELMSEAGKEWIFAVGLRNDTVGNSHASRPVCITRLWLNPDLTGIDKMIRDQNSTPVYSLIESIFGRSIKKVEQEVEAILLDAADAANLGSAPGTAGLRVKRRYFDQNGELLEMTDNIHPGDRFRYRIELSK